MKIPANRVQTKRKCKENESYNKHFKGISKRTASGNKEKRE